MGIASGLGAVLGFGTESVYGTAVTPTRYLEFNSESLHREAERIQGQGLRGTGRYGRASRHVETTHFAEGDVEMDLPTKGLGIVLRAMFGGTPVIAQQGGTAAYRQIHQPGDPISLTLQKLVPKAVAGGATDRFTYQGAMCTSWEIACDVGEIATLSTSWDCEDEDVNVSAAGTPAYSADAGVFHFAQGSVILGGTPSTTGGLVSIAGGTTAASILSITLGQETPMKTDRYFLGSAGLKAQPIENDWRAITGSMDCEFTDLATFKTRADANTDVALELKFEGATISGAYKYTLDLIVPVIRLGPFSPEVDGPDVVDMSVEFEGKDNGVDAPIQAVLISTDTAAT